MELERRLAIVTEGARYDVSCASSGSHRQNRNGIGNAASCGICHSWTSDGRCVSLLKLLMTNHCAYDCAYCINRKSNDHPRAALTPEEIADLTIGFYRRNYIEGLFLSTGVVKNPDYTMELLIRTVRLLREVYCFNGYVHLKLVPGADPLLVEQAGLLADRVSVNIELPTREGLALLAPEKSRDAVLEPMKQVRSLAETYRAERRVIRSTPRFAPAGQSTQLIVGATNDSDLQIVRLAEGLYGKMELKRVYYSAFVPVNSDRNLPVIGPPPLLREHRLYQADWLLRYYGFSSHELLDEAQPNLDVAVDPKANWALNHRHLFPVEVNRADYEVLLRVPGIGIRSAKRIVRLRRQHRLSFDDLHKLGVVLKRARLFVTASGKRLEQLDLSTSAIRARLCEPAPQRQRAEQLPLFPFAQLDLANVISGEL